jgi:hypothetical protein
MLSDLRESGAIEQDADMVLFINKAADTAGDDVLPVELMIAKHRNGETADIPLNFIGKFVHFVDSNIPFAKPIKKESIQKDDLEKAEFPLNQSEGEGVSVVPEGDFYDVPLPPIPEEENKPPINEEELEY